MPRKARPQPMAPAGPGALSQRTDLSKPAPQKVATPTAMPYGEAGQLAAAQSALPLPNSNVAPPPAAPGGPVAPPGPLLRPTERPGEHIGAPVSEIQTPQVQDPSDTVRFLERLIQNSKQVDARVLQMYLALRGAQPPASMMGLPNRSVEAWQLPGMLGG